MIENIDWERGAGEKGSKRRPTNEKRNLIREETEQVKVSRHFRCARQKIGDGGIGEK